MFQKVQKRRKTELEKVTVHGTEETWIDQKGIKAMCKEKWPKPCDKLAKIIDGEKDRILQKECPQKV